MAYDKTLGEFLKDMVFVNTFCIETRYPAIDPLVVSKEDAEECFRIVERVITRIDEMISKYFYFYCFIKYEVDVPR